MADLDARAELIARAVGALLGALFGATFGTDPILWTILSAALFTVIAAGLCFTDHRGWAGTAWLVLAVGLYVLAAPVQSWANSQDKAALAVHDPGAE